jgi:hypothetical protein
MNEDKYTVAYVANSIIAEIKKDEVLMACKSFSELHDYCDANCLGCSEELLDVFEFERAIKLLNAAQTEVHRWLSVQNRNDS